MCRLPHTAYTGGAFRPFYFSAVEATAWLASPRCVSGSFSLHACGYLALCGDFCKRGAEYHLCLPRAWFADANARTEHVCVCCLCMGLRSLAVRQGPSFQVVGPTHGTWCSVDGGACSRASKKPPSVRMRAISCVAEDGRRLAMTFVQFTPWLHESGSPTWPHVHRRWRRV